MKEKYEYKKAIVENIDELVRTRIIVLRAANKLSDDVDMSVVEKESYAYYKILKHIVIGTHGTALSTILNFYDNGFGCEDFLRIIDWMPYIIELDFEGDKLVGTQEHCHVEKEFKGKQRADKK